MNKGVIVKEFEPTTREIQDLVTNLLHKRTMEAGKVTLSNLGYLHSSALRFNVETGTLDFQIYFDVRYCLRPVKSGTSGAITYYPVDELEIFSMYLVPGDIREFYSIEKIMLPKTSNQEDENHRYSLTMKDDAKFVETDVLVIHADLGITLAAAMNISLLDPNFKVSCRPVGMSNAKKDRKIMQMVKGDEVPVYVTLTHSVDAAKYDKNEIPPYFSGIQDAMFAARKNRRELNEDIKDKADKAKKKREKKDAGQGFSKYA